MPTIAINGYKSFLGKNFSDKFKNKYSIIHYNKDINNKKEFLKFINKKKIFPFYPFCFLIKE